MQVLEKKNVEKRIFIR